MQRDQVSVSLLLIHQAALERHSRFSQCGHRKKKSPVFRTSSSRPAVVSPRGQCPDPPLDPKLRCGSRSRVLTRPSPPLPVRPSTCEWNFVFFFYFFYSPRTAPQPFLLIYRTTFTTVFRLLKIQRRGDTEDGDGGLTIVARCLRHGSKGGRARRAVRIRDEKRAARVGFFLPLILAAFARF